MKFAALLFVLFCVPAWAQNVVTVRVTDGQKPLVNATVALRIWGEKKWRQETLHTSADGTTTLELAAPLDAKEPVGEVTVHANGFALQSHQIDAANLNFTLKPGGIWQGQVLNEADQPIANARIGVTAMKEGGHLFPMGDEMEDSYSATSGDDGRFIIQDVPLMGEISYSVAAPGFARSTAFDEAIGKAARIVLVPGAALKGRILGMDGRPLANTNVIAQGTGASHGYGQAKTATDGTFTLESLGVGSYNVIVDVPAGADYIVPAAADVGVNTLGTKELPTLQATKGLVIEGVVRDKKTGKPVADAQIGVYGPHRPPSGAAMTSSEKTGADGQFKLRVLPGENKFYFYDLPEGYLRGADQTLNVTDETPGLAFDLQPAPTLTGTIVDEKNQPIAARLLTQNDGYISSDAAGKWSLTPQLLSTLGIGGGKDETGYYEVLSSRSIALTQTQPITIKVRKSPWRSLSGRVVAPDGTPRAGVEVEAKFYYSIGDDGGARQTMRRATTDADGFYRLDKIRAGDKGQMAEELDVKAKADGFVFVSGGAIAPDEKNWRASDIVLNALDRQIEGVTAPGVRVVAAGKTTQADANGQFQLKNLPAGEVTVYAALDGSFGRAMSAGEAPVKIELKPIQAQGVDVELGRDAWREVINETQNGEDFYARNWVLAQLNAADGETFAQLQASAAEPPTPNHDWSLYTQLQKWAPRLDGDNRAAQIESVARGIQDPETRLTAWLDAAIKVGDDTAVGERALREAKEITARAASDISQREYNLYRVAVVTERARGAQAGAAALDEAISLTLKSHGPKNFVKGGYYTAGRDGTLAYMAEIVAQGSPQLLRRLLVNIAPEAGDDVAALGKAIPVVAQTHGVEAALPLLEELRALPKPDFAPDDSHTMQNEPQFAFDMAARRLVPLLGANSPERALELARRISDEGGRARALASAATFAAPETVAPLWREAVTLGDIGDTPRFAARAFERDAQLGRELFALARTRGENSESYDRGGFWAPYAFYLARADAATARLELEREWSARLAGNEGQNLAPIAMAMSAVDGERALEMARQIPSGKDNFWSLEARRKIGQYLVATPAQRRDWPFDRWGATDTWQPGDEEW